jgi:hypothetical protein
MKVRIVLFVCAIAVALLGRVGAAADGAGPDGATTGEGAAEIIRFQNEYSRARIEPARLNDGPGLAIRFQGTHDLHYYASEKTAPAPGLQLTVEATSESLRFAPAVLPKWEIFNDPASGQIQVYVGDFTVFVPIETESVARAGQKAVVTVRIAGIACTSQLCLPPFEKSLTAAVDLSGIESWRQISLDPAKTARSAQMEPAAGGPQSPVTYTTGIYYLLAILAGLSITSCLRAAGPAADHDETIDQANQTSGSASGRGLPSARASSCSLPSSPWFRRSSASPRARCST